MILGFVHTYAETFENASFLSVLGYRPHGDGVFSRQKRSFSKTLSRVDLFENAVLMLSCGRVKMELFENDDVTASIHYVSEHAHGSLGIMRGHSACLFSFIEVRSSHFAFSSVFVWTEIFSKTFLVWTKIFSCTDKERCVFKNIRIRVDVALISPKFLMNFCEDYQNSAILKIIQISKSCHDRFTANYPKFLSRTLIQRKI